MADMMKMMGGGATTTTTSDVNAPVKDTTSK